MADIDLSSLLTRPAPSTWLFAGDSITQGAVHTRGWRDYTQLFRERLGEMVRNDDVVINSAVGGWGVESLAGRLEERVLRFRPDALFTMFGTNDAAQGAEYLPSYEEQYAKVIETARSAGIGTVVVQTTVPMWPIDAERVIELARYEGEELEAAKLRGFRMRLEHMAEYVGATREVAGRMRVPLIDHWAAWDAVGSGYGQLLDGRFHPNEYGHRLIAHTIFGACGMWDERSWTCRLFVPVG